MHKTTSSKPNPKPNKQSPLPSTPSSKPRTKYTPTSISQKSLPSRQLKTFSPEEIAQKEKAMNALLNSTSTPESSFENLLSQLKAAHLPQTLPQVELPDDLHLSLDSLFASPQENPSPIPTNLPPQENSTTTSQSTTSNPKKKKKKKSTKTTELSSAQPTPTPPTPTKPLPQPPSTDPRATRRKIPTTTPKTITTPQLARRSATLAPLPPKRSSLLTYVTPSTTQFFDILKNSQSQESPLKILDTFFNTYNTLQKDHPQKSQFLLSCEILLSQNFIQIINEYYTNPTSINALFHSILSYEGCDVPSSNKLTKNQQKAFAYVFSKTAILSTINKLLEQKNSHPLTEDSLLKALSPFYTILASYASCVSDSLTPQNPNDTLDLTLSKNSNPLLSIINPTSCNLASNDELKLIKETFIAFLTATILDTRYRMLDKIHPDPLNRSTQAWSQSCLPPYNSPILIASFFSNNSPDVVHPLFLKSIQKTLAFSTLDPDTQNNIVAAGFFLSCIHLINLHSPLTSSPLTFDPSNPKLDAPFLNLLSTHFCPAIRQILSSNINQSFIQQSLSSKFPKTIIHLSLRLYVQHTNPSITEDKIQILQLAISDIVLRTLCFKALFPTLAFIPYGELTFESFISYFPRKSYPEEPLDLINYLITSEDNRTPLLLFAQGICRMIPNITENSLNTKITLPIPNHFIINYFSAYFLSSKWKLTDGTMQDLQLINLINIFLDNTKNHSKAVYPRISLYLNAVKASSLNFENFKTSILFPLFSPPELHLFTQHIQKFFLPLEQNYIKKSTSSQLDNSRSS